MRRGELYRVERPSTRDPKKFRVFAVVSRQVLIDSIFSTVICAPVYSTFHGISTQVPVGPAEGLKHDSCICCDELISLPKRMLSHYVGMLSPGKLRELDAALTVALHLQPDA